MIRQFTSQLYRPIGKAQAQSRLVFVRFNSTDYTSKCEGLSVEPKDHVLWVKFNRPNKFNAITREMYEQMSDTFTKVNGDKSIRAVVLTGNGDYYSSGNDLTNFTVAMADERGPKAGLTKSKNILVDFVNSLINIDKFLIAAVNGPAVGIPVTTLPLCDYVIASDKATFQTPFTALGQCPEACSSITFPQIMGKSRASELLLLNMTWDAKKAQNYGLISEVIEHVKFHDHLDKLLKSVVHNCYPNSMIQSKGLIQSMDMKKKLLEANQRECDTILELWLGEECADAVQKFFKRSKK